MGENNVGRDTTQKERDGSCLVLGVTMPYGGGIKGGQTEQLKDVGRREWSLENPGCGVWNVHINGVATNEMKRKKTCTRPGKKTPTGKNQSMES